MGCAALARTSCTVDCVGVPIDDEDSHCKHIRAALENLDEIVEHFIALVEEEKVNAAVDHIHDLQAREVCTWVVEKFQKL